MKKIMFVAAAIVAMSFAACGSKTESVSNTNDSDSVVVDSDSVALSSDSVVVDSVK